MILCVVGARPNFMKIAPIMRALNDPSNDLSARLVHTGQHYDAAMKHTFFEQLDIPEPDVDLGVGSGTHAVQTAEIMKTFEPVLDAENPAAVLVVGDVNSTIACALVAAKKSIPVIHVEAGLRSFDRTMPEEINRVLTDQLADQLFTTEAEAEQNLIREGVEKSKIHFVGNVMIDSLRHHSDRAVPWEMTLDKWTNPENRNRCVTGYGVVTLHRPSNVDAPAVLEKLLVTLNNIGANTPLVFPMHPRTAKSIEMANLSSVLNPKNVIVLPPQGYLEMIGLMQGAKLVLTDSGGIQEETTALGVPCITLRENTERPITVTEGTNTIVGTDINAINVCYSDIISRGGKAGRIPTLWDGKAATRIASEVGKKFGR